MRQENLFIQPLHLVNFTRAVCPCIFPPPKHQPSKFFTRSVLKSPISPQLYSLLYYLTLFLSHIFPLFCRGFYEIFSLSLSIFLSIFPLEFHCNSKKFLRYIVQKSKILVSCLQCKRMGYIVKLDKETLFFVVKLSNIEF